MADSDSAALPAMRADPTPRAPVDRPPEQLPAAAAAAATAPKPAVFKPTENRKCEDCGLKQANFGLPNEKKKRWCAPCGKKHPGSFNVKLQDCEDCNDTHRSFGMPDERKKRWCGDCATKHAGAINLNSKLCVICGEGTAGYGNPPEEGEPKNALWCIKCKEGQAGTIIRIYQVRRPALPAAAARCCSLPTHIIFPPGLAP